MYLDKEGGSYPCERCKGYALFVFMRRHSEVIFILDLIGVKIECNLQRRV